MNPFQYTTCTDIDSALAAMASHRDAAHCQARFVAGGTNLIDLMKERLAHPATLIDINGLPLADIVPTDDGGLRLGALARNADTADHPLVRTHYPLLRAAIMAGASPQLRNMATNGGNLLQRTRCYYFYDANVPCNKHTPGSGCPATQGLARQHAIFGASAHCIATHPSDMCVALAALDAMVHVRSVRGPRTIAFAEFHRLPGTQPELDTTLAPDELITHIQLPPAPRGFEAHSTYLKLRERASYAFALVSVAAALDIGEDGRVRAVRVALGGVAHKPWRNVPAESLLVGQPADKASFKVLADAVMADARAAGGPGVPESSHGNSWKIPMAHRAIVRALEMAAAGIPSNTGEDGARCRGEQPA
ncbi:MAG TPA: xanthine dehydrogenase family protein subunit M [Candidatus Aquabacterium excrementipullorum]|nr:xanthine dehydrogenase family protein subunit M [Candidatus Aquabacterium excrementipullorum]